MTNIPMFKPTVKVQWYTENGDQMLVDIARVSVKDNEGKPVERLIRTMMERGHSSPFQMANLCVEVHAPRDISRQILRHWSLTGVQEWSQRYSEVTDDMFVVRETRMKHPTNRQMSVDIDKTNPTDMATSVWWESSQRVNITQTKELYKQAISRGIAKEVARVILPEGNTMSRLFLNGSIRTWIYYLKSRQDISATQREHVWVADRIAELFQAAFPITYAAFFDTPLYSMVHTVSGVSVARVRTAEDVHHWATVISDTYDEVLVSFQPNHGHCRVTWNANGKKASWCDYNLYPVDEPIDGDNLDMKVENNAK